MYQNVLKEKLKGGPVYGCFVNFPSGDIAEMTASIGFDFILIDNEHGGMDWREINEMVRGAQLKDVPALVRCPEPTYSYVQKTLDLGADGIQIPMVDNAEKAEELVRRSNYPPNGTRGMSLQCRAAGYGMCEDKIKYREKANRDSLKVIQIETEQAVESMDEILQVDGVDVFFVGPGDLAADMLCESYQCEKVQRKTEKIIRRITAAGRTAGVFAGTPEETERALDWGARYIVTSTVNYMVSGGKNYLNTVRKSGGRRKSGGTA